LLLSGLADLASHRLDRSTSWPCAILNTLGSTQTPTQCAGSARWGSSLQSWIRACESGLVWGINDCGKQWPAKNLCGEFIPDVLGDNVQARGYGL
jgi:hypothetical protein